MLYQGKSCQYCGIAVLVHNPQPNLLLNKNCQLGMLCRNWTQRAAVSWLLNTQLCPLIWALILGLLAVLVYKVCPAHTKTLSVNGCSCTTTPIPAGLITFCGVIRWCCIQHMGRLPRHC
jgi:hypothetical protein